MDPITDTLVSFGSELKALGETPDGAMKFGAWLVLYGSPGRTDISQMRDYFTKSTDFDFEEGDKTTVYYNHGLDPELKRRKLGTATLHYKDAGIWMEGQLKARDDYEAKVQQMIKAGKLGASSGVPSHLVERKSVGDAHEILMWPLGKDASLTPTPAEPLTSCISLKALFDIEEAETKPEIPDDNLPAGKSFVDHSEQVLATNAEFLERVESLIDMRCIKAGRVLSQANCDRIQGHVDSLQTTVEQMRALLSEHGPQDAANDTKAVEAAQTATKAVEELNAEIDDLEIMFLQQQMKLSQLLSH